MRKLQQQLKQLNVNFLRLYFNLFKFNKGNKDRQDQIIMIKPFPGELTK